MAADDAVEAELQKWPLRNRTACQRARPPRQRRAPFHGPPDATDINSVMEIAVVLVATRPISLLVISSVCIAVATRGWQVES